MMTRDFLKNVDEAMGVNTYNGKGMRELRNYVDARSKLESYSRGDTWCYGTPLLKV